MKECKIAFAVTQKLQDGSFGAALYPFDSPERREIAWLARRTSVKGGRTK